MKTRVALLVALLLIVAATTQAKVITRPVPYQSEGFKLEGYLAYDDSLQGKRPGILVVHEWWGLNEFARKRAEQLAGMGYVAFALDMYGKGKVTDDPRKAAKRMRMVQMNVYRWRQRVRAGLEVLKNDTYTDPDRIAAIGYGWGGASLQQLVFMGTDIKGAVLFGSFMSPPADRAAHVEAKILVLQGAADPYLDMEDFAAFIESMNKSGVDWHMVLFGGAKHGFSNPDAARYKMKEIGYNETADRLSWNKLNQFLADLFQK